MFISVKTGFLTWDWDKLKKHTLYTGRIWLWLFVVALLLGSGAAYRVVGKHYHITVNRPIKLPVPLEDFPLKVGNWVGKESIIPTITREYMEKNFADDFLSRRYINNVSNQWADVYVVYCASKPGGILGHRPRVCYRGHGWIHDSTEQINVVSQSGRDISCLLHRFHRPAPQYDSIIVLNFYILNGQITTDEDKFSGYWGRRVNIAGDPARYVAQVQISSVHENFVRSAAREFTDLILRFLPDKKSEVRRQKLEVRNRKR